MLRATSVKAAKTWRDTPADTVVLEFDDRHRRRMTMAGTRGLEFLLDLPDVIALRSGDALVLEDGRLIEVVAAPEPLVEIRGKDAADLVRVAWHLGNRHLPTQLLPKALRIRRDHVIEEMVRGLGARVMEIEAPFDPEGGAYLMASPSELAHNDHAHSHGHHHDHKHGHGHHHAHHGDDHHDHHGDDHKHDHGPHTHGHGQGHHHHHAPGEACDHPDHHHDHAHHHGHSHTHGHKA
ncbi:urease accessory protein UreE [Afipia sp. P52-10]|uniref:urease accessory protein UreE n=1 Tax=Afipia sp. P52-10 TaxID=1429916 RepID=UPI0004B75780|nr:urease accessory protein UreE [Afipia sp. P52-10]